MATATQDRAAKGAATTPIAGSPSKARSSKAAKSAIGIPAKVRKQVTRIFGLATDETRFQVLEILSKGEQNVGDMCTMLGTTQPALSHHLSLLRHARLVEPRRDGKNNFYSLTPSGIALWSACSSYAAVITEG